MRKTRFFYGKKVLLALLLAWLALLNEAVTLAIVQEKETTVCAKKIAKKKKETMPEKVEKKEPSEHPEKEKHIRVLLMDTDYGTYYHPSVTVLCQGERNTYTPENLKQSQSPLILSGGEEGICIESLTRQEGPPVYKGILEIHQREEGLVLINELPLEEYLKAVVPSEMPSSFEMQALMAQAVCARTYACKQIEEGRLKKYGADVDDSVNFQVYGNIASRESTARAVEDTKGKVLCQDGELIQAYYFSTSAGATSTDEVWGAKEAASYLKSVECMFDQSLPWSSWSVSIPWHTLEERAKEWMGEKNNLLSLEIVRKNQSGAVTGLRLIGEHTAHTLEEEYGIREFLSPKGCSVTQKDGSVTEGGTLLPSAYFTMEYAAGRELLVYGKGYGHGVGMSQNAANEMALEGYSYEEILHYFFKDVEIKSYDSLWD